MNPSDPSERFQTIDTVQNIFSFFFGSQSYIMKYSLFIWCMLLLSCTQTDKIDEAKEKQLILKVINDETLYFMAHDLENMKNQIWEEDYYFEFHSLPNGGAMICRGAKEALLQSENYFQNVEKTNFKPRINSEINIEVRGNFAWVTYISTGDWGPTTFPQTEIRILEKRNEKWKMLLISSAFSDFSKTTPPFQFPSEKKATQ